MTTRIYTDRSRIETHQACARRRFLEYHQDGLGITSVKKSLPLAVGGAVHVGLSVLLTEGQRYLDATPDAFSGVLHDIVSQRSIEKLAVDAALADFAEYSGHLDIPTENGSRGNLGGPSEDTVNELDEYLYREQASLVEALTRAYARRRLKPLLTQYEVLEVEREGEWLLGDFTAPRTAIPNIKWLTDKGEVVDSREGHDHEIVDTVCDRCGRSGAAHGEDDECLRDGVELWFMSRPDALLRDRESNQLYLLSFKTTGSWDHRKEKDAQHDMQGLSEGVEVERRLAEWWDLTHNSPWCGLHDPECSRSMYGFLANCPSPPRILGIRYEYLLKGERWRDPALTARFQTNVWSQRSHLIRGYLNAGMAAGDEQWNWSFSYLKPDGSKSKLYAKNWPSVAITDHMSIEAWIELLDRSREYDSALDGDMVPFTGYASGVQSTGTTAEHPLDSVFVAPFIVFRSDDDLRDLVESIEAQERRVADGVAEVNSAADEGERRSALNRNFPMSRRACIYPWPCSMLSICYGGEEVKRAPLATGLYTIRTVNHKQELQVADETSR
jgi:hypothetical protein